MGRRNRALLLRCGNPACLICRVSGLRDPRVMRTAPRYSQAGTADGEPFETIGALRLEPAGAARFRCDSTLLHARK